MNALLLAAAVLLGQCQQVNGQTVCESPKARVVTAKQTLKTDKHGICVRIIAPEGGGTHSWGSGTLIGGDETRAYVLTNRHVVGNASEVIVWHKSGPFTGRVLRAGSRADLAVIMIRRPSYVWPLVLASEPPTGTVKVYGFPGVSNVLVQHTGQLTWATPPNYNAFNFGIANGESGAGVFNERGELVGVAFGSDPSHSQYAVAVSQARLAEFLGVELCDERVLTITPFFVKFRHRTEGNRPIVGFGGRALGLFAPTQAYGMPQDIAYNPGPNLAEAVPPPPMIGPAGTPMFQDPSLPPVAPKAMPPVSKITPSPQLLPPGPPTQLPALERTPRLASPQQLPADTLVPGPMAAPMMAQVPVTIELPLTIRARVGVGLEVIRGLAEVR